jgi:hypothetical protein
MAAEPLGFDFPLMSPLSVRAPHAVPREEMLAEVEQELADRRGFYGRMVARQKMSAGDAARHIDTLTAIGADLREPGLPTYSWADKVRELRRELAIRRAAWPRRIAKPGDPLDEATAIRRMERLDAVHFAYWIQLFESDDEFHGRSLAPPHFLPSDGSAMGVIRAYVWRIWDWERRALAAGDPAARPAMAAFYAAMDDPASEEAALWDHYRHCAARLGFVQIEEKAA